MLCNGGFETLAGFSNALGLAPVGALLEPSRQGSQQLPMGTSDQRVRGIVKAISQA